MTMQGLESQYDSWKTGEDPPEEPTDRERLVYAGLISLREEDFEPYFSHYACDYCNSSLGGNRYDIVGRLFTAYREVKDWDVWELDVCEDCFTHLMGA